MPSDLEMHPIKPELSADQSVQDRRDLAALGHEQVLSRKFDTWSLLSLAFCVLGTWSTFAQDLSSGLSTGGPITILWGLVLVTACNICVALSLSEICSSMPTALGQAYWVARLWDTPLGRFVSYMCAWITTFGWWTLTASQVAFMADFLLGMKLMFDVNWGGADEGWLEFVVYVGTVIVLTVINAVSCRKEAILPWLNYFIGVWFVGLFIVFIMALPIAVGTKSDLRFQSARFAFGEWINPSDWPDGVIWFTGLVQAAYGLTAFDSVIHMVEEIPAPRKNAPKVMYLAVTFGAVSGFAFMVMCLLCIQNIDKVMDSPSGLPFVELVQETVGTKGGAVLIALFIFSGLGQGISIMTTASRLTWGFARDGGLPFYRYLNHIDSVWQAPIRALWFQGVIIGLVGILYLFASTVLDAILSVSTIALTISYALPITALLTVGREKLPPGRFCLGRWGVPLNLISLAYCCVTTVFFFFPASSKPSPSDMNYAIAVFGVMLIIAIAFWFIQGNRTYLKTEGAINELAIAEQVTNGTMVEDDEPKAEGGK